MIIILEKESLDLIVAKVRRQAIKEGFEKGRKSAQLEIAKSMLEASLNEEIVFDFTGVAKRSLRRIKEELDY